MELEEFTRCLQGLSGPAIAAMASDLRHEMDSADGEISWWRATTTIAAALKRHHRSREAGMAAHRASLAVLDAAGRADEPVNRDDATLVARAASEVARAIVAGRDPHTPRTATAVVLAPWQPVVAA